VLLLAIDTSGRDGSLALASAEGEHVEVLELVPLAGRMYSAQVIPSLQDALEKQGLKKSDLGALVVAAGPGSFTGLRVGLSTVKGLSEVLGRPIVAVSVLEAAARMAGVTERVIVAIDAGRKQVFVGDYEFGADGSIAQSQELLSGYDEFFRMLPENEARLVSPDQAVRDAGAAQGHSIKEIPSPQADTYARLGWAKLRAGETVAADVLEANYLRASDAELFSLPKLSQ
jgi:tRNA threonylcarbamoyladenosine biosynthesis protein TsaB